MHEGVFQAMFALSYLAGTQEIQSQLRWLRVHHLICPEVEESTISQTTPVCMCTSVSVLIVQYMSLFNWNICVCVCVFQGQGWWLWNSGSRWHACGVRPRRLPQCCGFPPQPLLQTTRSNLQQLHFLLEPGKFVCPPEPRRHSHHLDTHSACTQPASSV